MCVCVHQRREWGAVFFQPSFLPSIFVSCFLFQNDRLFIELLDQSQLESFMGVWLVSRSSCLLISKLDITSPEPSAAVSSKNPTGFSQNALGAVPCKVAGVAFWRGILISQNQRDPSPSSVPAWSPWLGLGQLCPALVMPSHPCHTQQADEEQW